jgi:L-fucose isomerase-like protein
MPVTKFLPEREGIMAPPRIGFVTCVHPTYSLPSVLQHRDAAISGLQAAGCEVIAPEAARDLQDKTRILDELKNAEIDLLLFFFCTWVDEELTLSIAQELDPIPLLLWALPYLDSSVPMPSPMTGIIATGSNLRRIERPFLHQIGGVDPDRIRDIARIADNASAVTKLRMARFGIFGQSCPGMMDTACDDALLRKFLGVTIIRGAIEELIGARDAASELEARLLAQRLTERIGRSEVPLDDLADQYRMLLGMKALVRKHQLNGFAVRCWPELRDQRKSPICLAMAELAESGIVSACAADLTALITSYILTSLAGQPSSTLEITAYLEEQNALQLAHCGSAAASLAHAEKGAVIRRHMRTGAGAVIEFPFKPKPVTIAKLLRPFESGVKMFVAQGEVIPSGSATRGTVATVRVEPSPGQFIESMMQFKVEHQLILVYGDWMEALTQFAQFTGIEILRAEDYQLAQFAGLKFLRPFD